MDRSPARRDAREGGLLRDDTHGEGGVSEADDEFLVHSGAEPTIAPTPAASVGLPSLNDEPGATPTLRTMDRQWKATGAASAGTRSGALHENLGSRTADIEQRTYPQRQELRAPADAVGQVVAEDEIIDVAFFGENVETHTRVRVGEEVEISKEGVQRTQQVAASVRHERVHVEGRTFTADEPREGGNSSRRS